EKTQKEMFHRFIADEIIKVIFCFLDPKVVIKLSTICKQWNEISNSQSLWKHFCLSNTSYPPIHPSVKIEDWKTLYIRKSKFITIYPPDSTSPENSKLIHYVELPQGILLNSPTTVDLWFQTKHCGVILGQ